MIPRLTSSRTHMDSTTNPDAQAPDAVEVATSVAEVAAVAEEVAAPEAAQPEAGEEATA